MDARDTEKGEIDAGREVVIAGVARAEVSETAIPRGDNTDAALSNVRSSGDLTSNPAGSAKRASPPEEKGSEDGEEETGAGWPAGVKRGRLGGGCTDISYFVEADEMNPRNKTIHKGCSDC